MPVTPKNASTVILIRDQARKRKGPFEVLMVKRNSSLSFVPGAYVFPGGSIDPEDSSPESAGLVYGMDTRKALELLDGMDEPGKVLGAWVAAARETFEEAGILLACRSDGKTVPPADEGWNDRLARYREMLLANSISFSEILTREGLMIAADRLHYFSHWITPEISPIRFDVRFFLALSPEGQEPSCDGTELIGIKWVTPDEAMEGFHRGRFDMVLPTLITMEELSRFKSSAKAIASTAKKKVHGILTRAREVEGRITEIMPDGRVVENLPLLMK